MRNRNHIRMTSDGFSFHTFELKHYTSKIEEFDQIFKRLKQASKKDQFYELTEYDTECYFCGLLCDYGIRIYLTKLKEWYTIKLVINPRRLIDPKSSYLGIMLLDEKSLDTMEHRFTDLMRNLKLPEFIDDWSLTRIDLCVNFLFDRKKLPRQIIQLISRGPIAKGYIADTYTYHSEKNHKCKYKLEKHSIKIANKSIALVAYDKNYQAKIENLAIPNEMIPRGILRLELQCGHDWISEKTANHKLKSTREKIIFFAHRSQKYIRKYAQKLYMSGEYCQASILKDRIQAANSINTKSKDRMFHLVNMLRYEKYNFDDAINELPETLSKKELRTLLAHFDKLGISPIPLDGECKLKTVLSIPAILEMLDEGGLDVRFSIPNKSHALKPFKVCIE